MASTEYSEAATEVLAILEHMDIKEVNKISKLTINIKIQVRTLPILLGIFSINFDMYGYMTLTHKTPRNPQKKQYIKLVLSKTPKESLP